MKKNIIITGANGYVGAMLVNEFLQKDDIGIIIGIDKEGDDQLLNQILERNYSTKDLKDKHKRFYFINQNLDNKNNDSDELSLKSWQEKVLNICENNSINVSDFYIVHTAWQIREIYGDRAKSWDWNVISSQNVFDFAFSYNMQKIIYFSTVSSYGAFKDNKIDYFFTEKDNFRKTKYLYAEEKRITEENLLKSFYLYINNKRKDGVNMPNDKDILMLNINDYKKEDSRNDLLLSEIKKDINNKSYNNKIKTEVVVLRPAAITGPRGRYGRIRFGLQSALSGTLKQKKSFIYNVISLMTAFVPVTSGWLRQFIHEDDVFNIIDIVLNKSNKDFDGYQYEVFNISPHGDCVLKEDMAKAVNKKMLKISPYIIRLAFFIFWHISRGKVPTAEGSWKGYSYPIAVSGKRITDKYSYKYMYTPKEAFVTKEGRYSFYCK